MVQTIAGAACWAWSQWVPDREGSKWKWEDLKWEHRLEKNALVEVNLQANTFKAFYENYARLLSGNSGKIKDGMVKGF